ncbi:MAG: NAD(+)/NADH kinase [Oscillospiraceae bacterium]|jgi:NAD+ kinase|nr:NAD(+)/NADH kinase [Oscillospiraceae bacterium]
MRKVVLAPNARRDHNLEVTRRVEVLLQSIGVQTVICPLYDEEGLSDFSLTGDSFSSFGRALDGAELIVAFGGDGTILRVARLAVDSEAKLLGVNMGGKGFMAELEREDIDALPAICDGGYTEERRMLLDVALQRGGKTVEQNFALNDVVVAGVSKVVNLAVYGDGQLMTEFAGDGVIVATPTGSTAYSMSAGGPIVEPTARNIIITPICAHVLVAKPFVLASDREVTVVTTDGKPNPAYMTVDGCENIPVLVGDRIHVRESKKTVCFAHVAGKSFYKRVSDKLGGTI